MFSKVPGVSMSGSNKIRLDPVITTYFIYQLLDYMVFVFHSLSNTMVYL